MRQASLWGRLLSVAIPSAIAAAAAAQYAPAPRQDVPQGKSSSPAASEAPASASRADVMRAVECIVARDTPSAEALLATQPYSSEERDKAVRLLRAASRCAHSNAQFSTSALVLRGAVAETFYESRFQQPPAARTPPAGVAPLLHASDISGREDAAFLTSSFELAQCTAPQHPDQVRALLATELGSDAEVTALNALGAAFTACVPRGTQLRVDRGGIRAILAETLYRWSVVQRDGPTSPLAAAPAATATAAAPAATAAAPGH